MDSRDKRLLAGVALALGAAAVTELRKPPRGRTWQGKILGLVPYDLRAPTPARVVRTLWNPRSPDLIVPHAFGVGWSINFGRLARMLFPPTTAQD